jgi:hypothetical protein
LDLPIYLMNFFGVCIYMSVVNGSNAMLKVWPHSLFIGNPSMHGVEIMILQLYIPFVHCHYAI